MGEADRNRIVGAEREFAAVRCAGQEKAAPQILAGKLDENTRVVDDRRLDEIVTGI
jgi:hypothetical protein